MIEIKQLTLDLLETHRESYVETLNALREGEISKENLLNCFKLMSEQGSWVFVAVDEEYWIVGTLTMLVEQKMLRWWAKAWHIEDVSIRREFQKQWIWSRLLEAGLIFAKEQWCYKVIGDTRDELVPRFAKFGFDSPERMIRKYL